MNGFESNVFDIVHVCAQPKELRAVHRPLVLRQCLNGGVLQSLSGVQCFAPFNGSANFAFDQVTSILCCYV